jgi:multidrug resistance efflux pump
MAKRRTPEEQLKDLELKESQLKARIQKKKAEVSTKRRKQDTRRKIIAGALALEHMEHDGQFAATMTKLMAEHVTRPEDRKLLGL